MLLENISLFWNLETTLQENIGCPIHLPLLLFSFSLFLNNFCIAPCLLSTTKLLRDSNKNLEHLFDVYPIKNIFGVYSQCRSKTFLDGVYVILILRACQNSHKASTKLDQTQCKTSSIYEWKFS